MSSTRTIASFTNSTSPDAVPDWVMREAKRTLINMLAISLSASVAKPVRIVTEWARAEGAAGKATAIGSGLRTSAATAAFVNGYMAHLQDYDDTHFPTVLHPTAPVWPAVFAAAEEAGATGRDALAAFALGGEIACRIALSTHPWHYDAGWHITGTAGVFGAIAGAGKLMGLSDDQLVNALGAGGTQAGGVREVFGTDSKAIHPAAAARNGMQAVSLAKAGFTGPDDIVGGRRGFWAVLSPGGHTEETLTGRLGEHWEIQNNGLKPYANGVVSHPIQDAVIRLRNEHNLVADQVKAIRAQVHPLVLELMNRPEPRWGLESKFSFQHCAAAALVDGAGHDAQFSDAKVADPVIAGLRALVSATPTDGIEEEEVKLAIDLTDGRTVETHVEHATGSPKNPMSDEVLESKFRDLATEVMPQAQAEELLAAVWTLDQAASVGDVARLMVTS